MATREPLIEKHEAIALFGVLLAGILAGSFVDFQLSSAIIDQHNPIAIFLAAYGQLPGTLGIVAGGALLFFGRNRKHLATGRVQAACGIIAMVAGTAANCIVPLAYLNWPEAIVVLLGILCSALATVAMRTLAQGAPTGEAVRVAVIVLIAVAAQLAIINIIKVPWGRPRMRLVVQDVSASFVPWWQPGTELRDTLTAAGIAAEEFKSFPSGHSGNAIMLVLLGLLPRLRPAWQSKRRPLVFAGFAFGLVVAASRIVIGAHFLSDVSMGLTIGLACAMAADRLVAARVAGQAAHEGRRP